MDPTGSVVATGSVSFSQFSVDAGCYRVGHFMAVVTSQGCSVSWSLPATWSLPAKRGNISWSLLAISWYLLAKSGSISWSLPDKTGCRGLCQPRDSWSLLAKRGSISWSLLAKGGSRLFNLVVSASQEYFVVSASQGRK